MHKITAKERKIIFIEAERILTDQKEKSTSYVTPYTHITENDIIEEHRPLWKIIDQFCQRLWDHKEFDIEYYLGISGGFSIDNTSLVTWLTSTQFHRLAMHIAFIMKKVEIETMERLRYRPAQDFLAELWCEKYGRTIFRPQNDSIPAEDYIQTIIDGLTQVDEHISEGHNLGIRYLDEIILHDELYGHFMNEFIPETQKIAKELFDFISEVTYIDKSEYNPNAETWDEQPESLRKEFDRAQKLCTEKFREIGKKYYPDGRLNDNTLAFAYLMAHAEDAMWGSWREEDDAL